MKCHYGCGNDAIKQLKNGNWICSDSYNQCPVNRKLNSEGGSKRTDYLKTISCEFCNKDITYTQIRIHQNACHLNPVNLKLCLRCDEPIKNYKTGYTCSNNCANKTFKRSGENHWNYKGDHYRSICFKYHKHVCIICGEDLMVEVHHYDEDNSNNDPKNLIPICSTHHRYYHSKYKYIVLECINEYYGGWDC